MQTLSANDSLLFSEWIRQAPKTWMKTWRDWSHRQVCAQKNLRACIFMSWTKINMANSRDFEYITIGIIGTVIVVFGIIANALSIIVWNRKSMRSTTGTYLIALSGAGLAHLFFFFLAEGIQILNPDILESYHYGVFYSYVGFPFYMMFLTCNIWITVGLTVDRCIKVCWSHKAQVEFQSLLYSCTIYDSQT